MAYLKNGALFNCFMSLGLFKGHTIQQRLCPHCKILILLRLIAEDKQALTERVRVKGFLDQHCQSIYGLSQINTATSQINLLAGYCADHSVFRTYTNSRNRR